MNRLCFTLVSVLITLPWAMEAEADEPECPDEDCPKGSICRVVADHQICVCENIEELIPLSKAHLYPNLCKTEELVPSADQPAPATAPEPDPTPSPEPEARPAPRPAPKPEPRPAARPMPRQALDTEPAIHPEVAAVSQALRMPVHRVQAMYASFRREGGSSGHGAFIEHLQGKYKTKRNVGIGLLIGGALVVLGTGIYYATAGDCDDVGGSDWDDEFERERECEDDRLQTMTIAAAIGIPPTVIGAVFIAKGGRGKRRMERAKTYLSSPGRRLGAVRLGPMYNRTTGLKGVRLSVSF